MKVKVVAYVIGAAAVLGSGVPLVVSVAGAGEPQKVRPAVKDIDKDMPASGPAVTNGLEVTLRPLRTPFGGRDALQFVVRYRNVSEKPTTLRFVEGPGPGPDHRFAVENVKSSVVWSTAPDPDARRFESKRMTRLNTKNLAPGESFEETIRAPGGYTCFWTAKAGAKAEKVALPFPAGQYRLTADLDLAGLGDFGRVSCGPVDFEVQAIDAVAEEAAKNTALAAAKACAVALAESYKKDNANDEFWKAFKPEDLVKNPAKVQTSDYRTFVFAFRAQAKPGKDLVIEVSANSDAKAPYGDGSGQAVGFFQHANGMTESVPVRASVSKPLIDLAREAK